MYHGTDTHLIRDITIVDEVGTNEVVSTFICQDCHETENIKEEARELVTKFLHTTDHPSSDKDLRRAKWCAEICIDEKMRNTPTNIDPMIYMPLISRLYRIKSEIKKL